MRVVEVDAANWPVYCHLAQAYEAEFSVLTRKDPDASGLYALDTVPGEGVMGFILFDGAIPVGIAAVKVIAADQFEMAEFFVVPTRRKQQAGRAFAQMLFGLYPGVWVVKQIAGAVAATAFWRSVIGACREDTFVDPYWGAVTRQVFDSRREHG